MFDLLSDLLRRITQDAVSYGRRLLQSQFKAAFLVEESRQIAALREQADDLERNGHKDLANSLRRQADALASGLDQPALVVSSNEPSNAMESGPKAKVVLSANVLASSHQGLLIAHDEQPKQAKRGRPKKIRPDASE